MATSRRDGTGTVVVTGAASGIGRRATVRFAAAGWRVVAVARSGERAGPVVAEASAAATGLGEVVTVATDLADLAQVRAAAERIRVLGQVDALVNNAAVFDLGRTTARRTVDGIEETFAVNHVAPFVLVDELAPALAADATVVTAGSKGLLAMPWLRLDRDDLDSHVAYRPTRAYYRSKLAQLLFTAELARRGTNAVALRIPSVRVDEDKIAHLSARLRAPYRLKSRFAADPGAIAARYVELAGDPGPPRLVHVDERGRDVRWPNGSDDPDAAAWLWDATAVLAAG